MTGQTTPTASTVLRGRLLRGGALLLVGKGVTQGASFLRNVIVARVVGVENFGIAATFAIMIYIFDMLGSLSVDKLLIQAKDGNDERFQSVAHALQAVRGMGTGLLIFVCAPLMAYLFGVPQATWAFRWLALVPVLRGFAHLDNQRVQRDLKFRGAVVLEVAQQLIPTLVAWPLAVWTHDYSAMLWLVLLQTAVATGGSFFVAERPYRWHWDGTYVKRFLGFGWPLIANAVLMFGIYQGDRFLIGTAGRTIGSHVYTLKDLGIYSVATSLTLTPMVAFANICGPLMLPLFAAKQTQPAELHQHYAISTQLVGLLSGFFALPLIIAGMLIVTTIYGQAYAPAGAIIGWMAAGQAVRMARFAPSMAAMALGDTTNAMYSNLLRFAALAPILGVIAFGGALRWIAMFGFCGEVLGLVVCLWKLERDHRIPALDAIKSAVALLTIMGMAGLTVTYFTYVGAIAASLLLSAFLIVFFVAVMAIFPSLRNFIRVEAALILGRRPRPGLGVRHPTVPAVE